MSSSTTAARYEDRRPIIAVTMGDPAGVGPEILVKALARQTMRRLCRPLVVGDARLIGEAVRVVGACLHVRAVQDPAEATYRPGGVDVLHQDLLHPTRLVRGRPTAEGGRAAFLCVRKAVELALAHQVEAVVTAPLSKEALHLAGYRYAGHTEILAELTGAENPTMLLVAGRMRVAHVSTHVSLREACDRVKRERVCQVIRLLHAACLRLGVTNPRIAVAGLNPHAGEAGLFGWEEEREIAPAVEEARRGGIEVDGPLPPDTVFAKAYGGMYDAVVAMYHDQGHIPVKLIGFRYDRRREQWRSVSGVNVTLGLPIVRTSVDHGTAFDLAGTGMASEESLVDAIRLAVNLCREPRTGRPREDGTSSQEKGHG